MLSLSLLLALAVVPGVAAATSFSSISWSVTGGTFSGPNSTGPITGGSVVYTPPGGSISTPSPLIRGGTLFLSIFGPSGAFTAMATGTIEVFGQFSSADFNLSGVPASPNSNGVIVAPPYLRQIGAFKNGLVDQGTAYAMTFVTTPPSGFYVFFEHRFTLGSEVRVPVPEPSTGMLLSVGLLAGIGLAGRGRRALKALRR